MMDNEFFDKHKGKNCIDEYNVSLSRSEYNFVIGVVLAFGFFLNYLEIELLGDWARSIGNLPLIVGYFISAFAGIYISQGSTNPYISLGGYCLVVLPVGLLLCKTLPFYAIEIVRQAMMLTGLSTVLMIVAATMRPDFFAKIGYALVASLSCLVVIDLCWIALAFFGFVSEYPLILDIGAAGIFVLLIGYDWYRAQKLESTLDNAVDCCVGLYLDIINLFLRLLRILSKIQSKK